MSLTRYQQGALAVGIGSAFWGLFWLPLRYLEQSGLPSLFAVAFVLTICSITAALLCVYHRTLHELKNPTAWIVGLGMGLSCVLYFYGIMTSDVVRVIFLFYLLPVWTTLAARMIYGEPIGLPQIIIIFLALAGLWLLLGGDKRLPLPNNVGDWCGLSAGATWGVSLALLKGKAWASATVNCLCTFFTGTIIALLTYFVFLHDSTNTGSSLASTLHNPIVLFVAIGFAAIIITPSMMGQIWGAGILPAPTSALLTMSEIIVATVSTYFLIGTELSGASALGAAVILTAVLADIFVKRSQL